MNKIYFAIADWDYGGVYISAPNLKEAKKIALYSESISDYIENYIDLECSCSRDGNKKIRHTEITTGELDMEEIFKEKLHWFNCENEDCESEEAFEIISDFKCKCKKCGHEFKIPYVNN